MGIDIGKIGNFAGMTGRLGEARAAFAELRTAVQDVDPDASGKSRFSRVLAALDRIIDLLRGAQADKSLPPQAQAAVSEGLEDAQHLRKDVEAGPVGGKEEVVRRVDQLVEKYRDRLGPLGGMLG